jgi:hypothetical protein
MYRLPSSPAIEIGVLRGRPVDRPATVSSCCEPIRRPRRSIAVFKRTIHAGGGFGLNGLLRTAGQELDL